MLSFSRLFRPDAASGAGLTTTFGNSRLIRQILVSLVIVGAAAAAYIFLVPGAPQQLAKWGIELPVAPAVEAAATPSGGQGGGNGQAAAGGQRGGGGAGGRGARAMVVVTAPVLLATINDKLTFLDYETTNSPTGLKIAAETDEAGEQAFAFAKDKEALVTAVDAALDELRADGTLAEISKKYFGEDVSQ